MYSTRKGSEGGCDVRRIKDAPLAARDRATTAQIPEVHPKNINGLRNE